LVKLFYIKGFRKTNLLFFGNTCLLIFGFEELNGTKKAAWQLVVLKAYYLEI
jgi:hypothetical protein